MAPSSTGCCGDDDDDDDDLRSEDDDGDDEGIFLAAITGGDGVGPDPDDDTYLAAVSTEFTSPRVVLRGKVAESLVRASMLAKGLRPRSPPNTPPPPPPLRSAF